MESQRFEIELNALRYRIKTEANLPSNKQFVDPSYDTIKPLVILLEEYLRGTGYTNAGERREIRLAILSLWTDQNVRTTYDLSVYQCGTILDFLEGPAPDFGLTSKARDFLAASTEAVEGRPYHRAEASPLLSLQPS